jgi:heptosyltransferase I
MIKACSVAATDRRAHRFPIHRQSLIQSSTESHRLWNAPGNQVLPNEWTDPGDSCGDGFRNRQSHPGAASQQLPLVERPRRRRRTAEVEVAPKTRHITAAPVVTQDPIAFEGRVNRLHMQLGDASATANERLGGIAAAPPLRVELLGTERLRQLRIGYDEHCAVLLNGSPHRVTHLPDQAPRSICILRLSALGDVCHTVPVLRRLQDAWPDCPITWVIGSLEHQLVGDIADVEFLVFDKHSGLDAFRSLSSDMRGRRFDALLMMQVALRASVASLLIPGDRRIGFDRARARDLQWVFSDQQITARAEQHVLDGLMGFASSLGAPASTLRWDIPIPQAALEQAEVALPGDQPTLLISPCSSQRTRNFRNWHAERYAAVADYAHENFGMRTIVTGGPTNLERDYAERISTLAKQPIIDCVGQTSIKELFALIARADVVLCPDSGPAHMATAAGTPVIGLYAGSNPRRTGPYLDRSSVVDRYPEAALAEFGRPVADLHWGQRVRDPAVMARIQIGDVTERLHHLMAPQP